MKILVTGGCGFIGTYLVNALIKRDHEVHILDREKPKDKNKKAKYYLIDLCENIDSILKNKYDIIYHLAAEVFLAFQWRTPKNFFSLTPTVLLTCLNQ